MDRKLASIQSVLDIQPIPNADAIEVLTVLGWKVVAKKGEFKVGDLVIYFEVDSILPESPEYEFLRKSNFRIKTIRLRGQVSQGLCLPLPTSPEGFPYTEGADLTLLLGVEKYEPYVPAQLAGICKGNFPSFLHKTDEMRIQAVPELLLKHQGKKFYVTEKVDGSSMTVYLKDGEFGVCSRNMDLKETEDNSFWKVARELDLENKLRSFHTTNIALQGELVGPGVQGNKLKLEKLTMLLFNVFNINTGINFSFNDFEQIAKYLDLQTVPVVGINYTLPTTVDELVFYSQAKSALNKDVQREGIVLRPIVEEYSEDLRGRLSFKCINPEFLLKFNE